ncbi:MAG: DUF4430 domain-containing protein [Clostridia bacterium]|nr:DUF4430 domain-containing protein [Clostridia bacterium]
MKTLKKTIALLLCAILSLCLFACGGSDDPADTTEAVPETITVKVTVKTASETILDNLTITLRDRATWPTVLDALAQACDAYEVKYTISSDGLMAESINDLGQTDDGMFWAWTLNGKEVSGRAGNTRVNENDTIVFSYENVGTSK